MFVKSELAHLRAAIIDYIELEQKNLNEPKIDQERLLQTEQKLIQLMSLKNKITNLIPDVSPEDDQLDAKAPVLVVEDSASMRELHCHMLWEMGFVNVLTATDGYQALTVLVDHKRKKNPIKLVLCDWNMPIMGGLELLKSVRKDKDIWDTPFFLITSNKDKAHILQAIKAGVSGYLVKPIAQDELESKLIRYIPDAEE